MPTSEVSTPKQVAPADRLTLGETDGRGAHPALGGFLALCVFADGE